VEHNDNIDDVAYFPRFTLYGFDSEVYWPWVGMVNITTIHCVLDWIECYQVLDPASVRSGWVRS